MLRIVEKRVPTHQMLPLPLTHINRVKKTGKHIKQSSKLAIYAPMIYTVLCVMLLMQAASITRESRRGYALEIETFWAL
jgi:hypothetical protein